uniref:Yeast CBS2 cytochrome b translational activator protein n=1 Tax=Saccharomyces cerevisiae TaxID=4932 RepID=A2NUR2_YEASX|nr:unnamed protein product [Saccharomyces cerevisiae]
MYSPHPHSR